jgi:hypothetical protein
MTRFGLGSIAGRALASGAAGVTLRVILRSGRARRGLALVTGGLSITVGGMRSIRRGRGGEWRRRTVLTSRPIRRASTRACTGLHPVFPDPATPGSPLRGSSLARAGRVRTA